MKFLQTIARNIKVQAHIVWLCARDPSVAWPLRLMALVIAGYALSPIDLIPDLVPILGLLDDAILIPLGLWLLYQLVPTEIYERHRKSAETALERPASKIGAAVILTMWLGAAIWLVQLVGIRNYF